MTAETPTPQQQLESLTERYWDLQDELRAVTLARAAIMNALKEQPSEVTI